MTRIERGNHFLSGFGTNNYLEDFFLDRAYNQTPITNISENDKRYKIELGLPGYNKEDLALTINKSNLVISGLTKNSNDVEGDTFQRKEFDYATFQRSFQIPDDVAKDKITAKYKEGLLNILLPKIAGKRVNQEVIDIN